MKFMLKEKRKFNYVVLGLLVIPIAVVVYTFVSS